MKKIKIYGLLACLCLLMQSCLFSEKDVFDTSSAQRAIASVEECQSILEGAENGWALKYYTGSGAEYGGYNIFAKFEGKNVTMASEMPTDNYDVGEKVTSLYKVASFQGTELSFDSHNELIHYFCEPYGYNDPGYMGDYEFVFRSVEKDKIVLTGKKYGVKLVMTPLPKELDWETELVKIATLADDAAYGTFNLIINGQQISQVGRVEHAFTLSTTAANGQTTVTNYPFIYTSDGVEMYEPFIVDGVEMSHFQWDSESAVYTCTDKGVDAKIEFYCPEGYKKYVGNYILKMDEGQIACALEQKRLGSTYSLKLNLSNTPVEFVFDYNVETDCIELLSQVVGQYRGTNIYFYPGYGSSFFPYAGVGFIGSITTESPMTITFTYNNNNPSVNTILLLVQQSGGWALFNRMTKPVLIKQN